MTAEGRQPQNVQDAVEATLRRLRREVGGRRPAERIEPQFTMPVSPSAQPPARDESAEPYRTAEHATEEEPEDPIAESELAEISVSEAEIPPIPPPFGPASYVTAEEGALGGGVAARPRRHWLRYVAALAVVCFLAVVGWWGYRQLAGRTYSGQVPVITADQTPEKVPPAEQPPAQPQSQQETVYSQIAPNNASNTAPQPEVLLPQPETPATPPPVPSTPASAPASASAPDAAPAATTAPAASTASAAGTSAAPATATPQTAPSPAAQPMQTATAAPSSTSTAAPASAAPTAAGNYRIQLAAVKTESDAGRLWKQIAAKYPDILNGLSPHLEKADLGAKGVYYRVQAGSFTDKAAARDICAKLKTKGQQCLVKP
jgi:hypothetical protein